MVQPEIIRRRLTYFDEYLKILRGLQRYSREEFLAEPERYGSAERFLQLALECLLDLGAHVVADEELGTIEVARDIPELLHGRDLLTREQTDLWIRMIGFRNILVHDYTRLDREVVWTVLHEKLDDLAEFRLVFARFL